MDKGSFRDFRDIAKKHVNHEVEVITAHGTFTGTLLSVGSDFLILRSRIRGQLVNLIIRLALIVAIFRLLLHRTGPFGFGSQYEDDHSKESPDESSDHWLK